MKALNAGDLVVGNDVSINCQGSERIVSAKVISVGKFKKPGKTQKTSVKQMIQIEYVMNTECGLITRQQPFFIDGFSLTIRKV
jgi:hypothetical protein